MGNTHRKNLFPPYRVRKEKEVNWSNVIYRSAMVASFFALMFFLAFSCIIVFVGAVRMYGGDIGMLFTTIYIFIIIAICIDINNYYFNRVENKKG